VVAAEISPLHSSNAFESGAGVLNLPRVKILAWWLNPVFYALFAATRLIDEISYFCLSFPGVHPLLT
jgi:hypothetical protein